MEVHEEMKRWSLFSLPLAQQCLPNGVCCSSCIGGGSCSLLCHFPPLNSYSDLWFAASQARTSQSPPIAISWAHLCFISAVATRNLSFPLNKFNKEEGDNEQLFRGTHDRLRTRSSENKRWKKWEVKIKPFIMRRKKAFLSTLCSLVIILLAGTLVLHFFF